jgi:hypothetical protein
MRPVTFKVVCEGTAVIANIAKVNGLTAGSQEQQPIKLLHQDSRWLMDGAKDGLPVIG